MKMKNDKDPLAWEEVKTRHIIQNEWIDFREHAYRFPNGKVFEPFYSYSRKDYVVIAATDCDGNYLCVRQFRQGIREVTTEFPAGGLERTDGREYRAGCDTACEDALQAAKRELLEETGCTAAKLTLLGKFNPNPALFSNHTHVYLAQELSSPREQHLDKDEFLHFFKMKKEEVYTLLGTPAFPHALMASALGLYLVHKEKSQA